MLSNMLQLAMSSVDEIEAQCSPECYPACRKAKDHIREISMLIQSRVSIWPKIVQMEAERELNEARGGTEKPDQSQTLQQLPGNNAAGVGQLEKVGRLRYLVHLIRRKLRRQQ